MSDSQQPVRPSVTRRRILSLLAGVGCGGPVFQRLVAQQSEEQGRITAEMLREAEWVAGIDLTDPERGRVLRSVRSVLRDRDTLRTVAMRNSDLPSLRFDPETGVHSLFRPETVTAENGRTVRGAQDPSTLQADDDISFLFRSVGELGEALRGGRVTAVQLAAATLRNLEVADRVLNCVVTLTPQLAMQQAERADAELKNGMDRGPLHGIPWGAKDLIAVDGYTTTWGAPQYRQQVLRKNATVARRLEQAGAVLTAKLSLGSLAMGDQWYAGRTNNPWYPNEGSSGSSAGSASAVAAGLLPFALGSETLGSIVSPSRRCGATGLRPTFGRVSRAGCMALSWTMDKIGPLTRSPEDCALVFDAIHGRDIEDPTTVDRDWLWPVEVNWKAVRVGKVENSRTSAAEEVLLETLEKAGAEIRPISLPHDLPIWETCNMLDAEAAALFHDLMDGPDTSGLQSWPETTRAAHYLSAIDYLHASRVRTKVMQRMDEVFEEIDVYVGGGDLGIANLTGHPCLVLPVMMADQRNHRQPSCATLTGRLYSESLLLAMGRTVHESVGVNERPDITAYMQ